MAVKEKENFRDLTTGSVPKKLFMFALPIVITNLLQAIYTIADMIIAGQFVGAAGMSAISIGGQLTMLVFVVISGLSNGGAAIIGQYVGAGKKENIGKVVGTLMAVFMIIAAIFMFCFIVFSTPLLHVMTTPAEAFDGTRAYLIICMIGTPFVYIYNATYAMLRGIGESSWPMRIILITTVVNVALDLLFVAVFGFGPAGAATATIIAQFISATLITTVAKKKFDYFDFKIKSIRIDKDSLGKVFKIGVPQAIQFSLTNISFLMMISLINSYGVDASAAAGACTKLQNFAALPGQAFMASLLTFTAQNISKKNYKRIYQAFGFAVLLATIIVTIIVLFCELTPETVIGLFDREPNVVAIGVPFLQIIVFSFLVENPMFCSFGVLTGAGHTHITMLCALSSAFVVRYLFAIILSGTSMGFNGIALAYVFAPIEAIAIALIYIISGKWKVSRIKV